MALRQSAASGLRSNRKRGRDTADSDERTQLEVAASIDAELITVHIQTLSGPLPPIIISAESKVRDLKLCVQTLNADFRCDRQKLSIIDPSNETCAGVVLLNHRTLQSYRITSSTNVVLIMLTKPETEVSIDDELKDMDLFNDLLVNHALYAVAIDVNSICKHKKLLFQLFAENLFVKSIKISGVWSEEHLKFCEKLLSLHPEMDIQFVVNNSTDGLIMLCVVNLCKVKGCSSIQLRFSNAECAAVASALRSMTSLQSLNLCGNQISDAGCVSLAPALQSMSSLQTLNLSDNQFGYAGCASLAPALLLMSSLQTLNLSENKIGDASCVSLAPALQSMLSLHALDLSFNKIDFKGCVALASSFTSMLSLQTLDLSHNKFGDAGCRELASALQSMSSLHSLNLSNNFFGAEGLVGLAPALQSMLSLRILDLSYNFIGAADCKSLNLESNLMPSLQILHLRCNQIGLDACLLLAPALQSMSSLQTLDLSENHIVDSCCVCLAPALASMSALTLLDLRSNEIGAAGVAALESTLQTLSAKCVLDLGDSRSSDVSKFQIICQFANGKTLTLDVQSSDTLARVKTLIHDKKRIPPMNLRLTCSGHRLDDRLTLHDFNITQGSTVHVIFRLDWRFRD